MKKTIVTLFLVLSTLVASAQSAPALLVGSDAVAYGRGGVSVATAANAFAVDNNAAAMSLSENKFDISVSYGMWGPQVMDNTVMGLGTFFRVGDRLAIGLSGRMLSDKPYETATSSGQVTGSFSPRDLVAGLGLSYALTDQISLGVSGRMLSSTLSEDVSGTSFSADLTAMYAQDAFSAALGVYHVGSSLSYGGDKSSLPMLAKLGAAYSIAGFTASAEADYLFSGALMAGLGLEYCFADIVSLRG
ncbi:MAG: PorV/PorQ family protein, partial [Bacteroidales bacterium]|nr:PorV/PorQ family protein [Bacteroidales bacterium]